ARAVAMRLVRARARLGRARPPRVFVTSLPKAGTHLATAALDELPHMRYSGWHVTPQDFGQPDSSPPTSAERPDPPVTRDARSAPIGADAPSVRRSSSAVDWDTLAATLSAVPQGRFVRAHFPWSERLVELLRSLGYRTVFVYRDPRDIAVSHAFYVTRLRRNVLHRRYAHGFASDSERILASIVGSPADSTGPAVPHIGAPLEAYLPWRTTPGVLASRFEDLVGAEGGGSSEAQLGALQDIARHVERPLGPGEARRLAARVWSPRSMTFRRGVVGDWRNHFERQHREAFRGRGARLLVAYGYERDEGWIERAETVARGSAPTPGELAR
ncbi:MAG TPA: hypothetical protein VGR10_07265, partial [Thermoleophilaceae bacterium]|nr:hypothetical protein [Thermoleophilaceae bacterium]